jgi:hypothetical protein
VYDAQHAELCELAPRVLELLASGCKDETAARALGVRTLRLDTNSALPEALALYRKSGWVEIARFNDDPYPDHFFEKVL